MEISSPSHNMTTENPPGTPRGNPPFCPTETKAPTQGANLYLGWIVDRAEYATGQLAGEKSLVPKKQIPVHRKIEVQAQLRLYKCKEKRMKHVSQGHNSCLSFSKAA